MRYNIVLIPLTQSHKIVEYAKIFSPISHQYLLGEKSLPHLTLCQFRADHHEAKKIWQQVRESLEQKSITLHFKKEISCISFDNKVHWVSLLPESNEDLIKMHLQVAKIVQHPLNRSYQDYDPHITLANTTNSQSLEELVKKLSTAYTPFEDTFIIAFGRSDESGQFLEVIDCYQPEKKINCRL